MSPATEARTRGFTLLELLVALAIFAVLAAMAYGGLSRVLASDAVTREQLTHLARLQKTFLILDRELAQAAPRGIRDEYGDRQPALVVADGRLEFTESGWFNPAGQARSTLRRVAFALQDGKLHHFAWGVLDRAQDSRPGDTVLLEGVESWKVECLTVDDQWVDVWPPQAATGQTPPDLPRAVRVQITDSAWGTLGREVPLAAGAGRAAGASAGTQGTAPP